MHPLPLLLLLLLTLLALSPSLHPPTSAAHTLTNHPPTIPSAADADDSDGDYVKEACAVTQYRGVCVRTLSSFSGGVGRSPTRWARAGVSVTIREVKMVVRFVRDVEKKSRESRRRGRSKRRSRESDALSTCVETVQDALDNLHQSLYVLRKLERGAFKMQMSNVLTWLSAALTDHDTCTDSFEGLEEGKMEKIVSMVKRRVTHASYLTSNALAIVDKLATTGLQDGDKD